MEECLKLIQELFPEIDSDIKDYVAAVLDSTCEDLEAVDDVYDALGEVLHGVDPSKTENDVKELCANLCFILKPNWTEKTTLESALAKKALESPIAEKAVANFDNGDPEKTKQETLNSGDQDNQMKKEPEVYIDTLTSSETNKGSKTAKKKRGKESKTDTKKKYGSSEVTSRCYSQS